MRRRAEGFSLIEAAVAIAIMAILAGAAMPLVVKALNQQREQVTRSNLVIAWGSLFGSTTQQLPNMRADFGFDPGVSLPDLASMKYMAAAGTAQPFAAAGPGFSWGWNGPYWLGALTTNASGQAVPADGWGMPIRLVNASGLWQVQSNGPDRVPGNGDDLVYPPAPESLSNRYGATLTVVIHSDRNVDTDVDLICWDRYQGSLRRTPTVPVGAKRVTAMAGIGATYTFPGLMPGSVTLNVAVQPATDPGLPRTYLLANFDQYAMIQPSQTQIISFNLVK